MSEADKKELDILRRVVRRFQHETVCVKDESEGWGFRSKKMREFLMDEFKRAGLQWPEEA